LHDSIFPALPHNHQTVLIKGIEQAQIVEDATRLDNVREALQREDLKSASRYGSIYKLEPIIQ